MASITIRNIEGGLKQRLRVRAAQHGRSMEDEVRDILRAALAQEDRTAQNIADAVHRRFAALGGFDMPEVSREMGREPPAFDE